ETHHSRKEDAPSGTALKIATAVSDARDEGMKLQYGRGGRKSRSKGEIGMHSVRGGGVVGSHEVMFLNNNDKITISHESFSREAFADGAITAARFIYKRRGIFGMEDVLRLTMPFRLRLPEAGETAAGLRQV
ncbi:MAG: dihydrodipicolinate reductase C-terminal domain-containing protein, partial [bacterium]|nr:dihydrodipicolinate reductase C-terminal domain-containing protein [bacterium]